MTRIKFRMRPVWHETGVMDTHSGRMLLVAESPSALLLRPKGLRFTLSLPWSIAYWKAAQVAAAMKRLDKINRKRAVKRGRV